MGSFPFRLADAPAQVSLFPYDNHAFVVQSFLDSQVTVTVSVAGATGSITDLVSGQSISRAQAPPPGADRRGSAAAAAAPWRSGAPTSYTITIPAHSYRAFTEQETDSAHVGDWELVIANLPIVAFMKQKLTLL